MANTKMQSLTPEGVRPEVELLLCCARTRIDREMAERIRALVRKDIDWIDIERTACGHRIVPLVYRSLQTACPEDVPRTFWEVLRKLYHANVCRNLFLTGEMLHLVAALEAHGIRAIPYRGPVLAAVAYGDIALRQFHDLDILVHPRDFLKARDLVVAQGYRLQTQHPEEAAHPEWCYVYSFEHPERKHIVELHQRLAPTFLFSPLDSEPTCAHLQSVSLVGRSVLSLAGDDRLLVLCVHGAHHCWNRLEWISDVAELISSDDGIQWHHLAQKAERLGCARALSLGLILAIDLLGAAVPHDISVKVRTDPVANALAAQVCERLLGEGSVADGADGRYRFNLRARERLADRLRYILNFVLVPQAADLKLVRLPSVLSFAYYALRPIRLIVKYLLMPRSRWRLLRDVLRT